MSKDGNMDGDVISRDMIIKALGWMHSPRGSYRNSKEKNRHGNTKLKNQTEEPERLSNAMEERSVATNGRLAIIMASSLSNMILYVHFHIYLLPASPLEYDTFLHLQNLEECPQHIVGLKKYFLSE